MLNSYNHKTPEEAKVLLLLAICGAKPSEFKYNQWGDNRALMWGTGKRIKKDVRDYVKMVFVGEHNQVLTFKEFVYQEPLSLLNRKREINKRIKIYRYIISVNKI